MATRSPQYIICANCLHLLTDLHFNNSKVCDICTKKEAK